MNFDEIASLIRRHEGTIYHVYKDSREVLTGGVGHAFHIGSKLSPSVVEKLFYDDLSAAYGDYKKLLFAKDIHGPRKAVIIDMIFNLGLSGFQKFEMMIEAMMRGDCDDVCKEMFDSRWAKQVGNRSEELALMWYDNKPLDYEPD